MSENKSFIIGVDIGGTHISAATVDQSDWKISTNNVVRNHVNSSSDAKSILQSWADAINACKQTIDAAPDQIKIGIAMPGPFDYSHAVSLMIGQSKYDALYKMNVRAPLSALIAVPEANIHFMNDAAAFLQGEVFAQNMQHKSIVLGITLGTGLGSAVWQKDHKAFDADLWNTPYKELIYEEYLVTRWFTRRFQALSGIVVSGLKEIITAHKDNPAFSIICDEYGDHLIHFIKFFSKKYSCKDFIIGGNIAKALAYFLENKKEALAEFSIITASLGEEAAIIGAASQFSSSSS